MTQDFVPFDRLREHVRAALKSVPLPKKIRCLYVIRNLFGKITLAVPDAVEEDEASRAILEPIAASLSETLGAHGHPKGEGLLFVSDATLEYLDDTAQPLSGFDRIFWSDRLMTGAGWWDVADDSDPDRDANRITLFSVKGGVGRTTTAAVLARHLARQGKRVLVVDLDLESPGLSSEMLDRSERPEFGVIDWFVEELVGQGDHVIERMLAQPPWTHDLDGDVRIAPAHGADPGEYLAKLGHVYVDRATDPWTVRLQRLLRQLETQVEPDFVLLESRSGLNDIAAATITDIDADVLLFATDSQSNWTDYKVLFDHWRDMGLAERVRERLWTVSALTPPDDEFRYLHDFRERSWELFSDRLYDDTPAPSASKDPFSFDLDDEDAPHHPLPIYWNRGFAAGASLRRLEDAAVIQTYAAFLKRFDRLNAIGNDGDTP